MPSEQSGILTHYVKLETITHRVVSGYPPPNAEKVKEQFESMVTVLKRTIPQNRRGVAK